MRLRLLLPNSSLIVYLTTVGYGVRALGVNFFSFLFALFFLGFLFFPYFLI